MFIGACKGLHCACCKTFGIGPLLFVGILYAILAANKSVVVALLLHVLILLAIVATACGLITGLCYWALTKITRHITRFEYSGTHGKLAQEARNAGHRPAIPAVDARRQIPVRYVISLPVGATDERTAKRQLVISQRRDER